MSGQLATARAHSNIAFIKYWGNRDDDLRIPENDSISMNLAALYTETTVQWHDDAAAGSTLQLNGQEATGVTLDRVLMHLDNLHDYVTLPRFAAIESVNNFPMGAGIASSASAFAALTLAAVHAAGHQLSEATLSSLARLGSGSASRSIPGGFTWWHQGEDHETSFAESIAPPDAWDLVDVIAVVSTEHKRTGSTQGHATAGTSDLQAARIAGAADRVRAVKRAIQTQDFAAFAQIVEHDSNLMHAIMMTSLPPLFYWQPGTLTIMNAVRRWREEDGLAVCYTLDAGPNVHCICEESVADEVRSRLEAISGIVEIYESVVGGPAQIISP